MDLIKWKKAELCTLLPPHTENASPENISIIDRTGSHAGFLTLQQLLGENLLTQKSGILLISLAKPISSFQESVKVSCGKDINLLSIQNKIACMDTMAATSTSSTVTTHKHTHIPLPTPSNEFSSQLLVWIQNSIDDRFGGDKNTIIFIDGLCSLQQWGWTNGDILSLYLKISEHPQVHKTFCLCEEVKSSDALSSPIISKWLQHREEIIIWVDPLSSFVNRDSAHFILNIRCSGDFTSDPLLSSPAFFLVKCSANCLQIKAQ